MSVEVDTDLAMVLPIPVPVGAGEDAVSFLDLSANPDLLVVLDGLFPAEILRAKGPFLASALQSQSRPKLEVKTVGDFEASFVPTLSDFDRLDERFRLPPGVWEKLPGYSDWGFCVFKLRRGKGLWAKVRSVFSKMLRVHPMAFVFPRRDTQTLFFPTVHVHDGEVHEEATFDHSLYCQAEPELLRMLDWQRSESKAPSLSGNASKLVDASAYVYRKQMFGKLPNRDTLIEGETLKKQNLFGPSFRLRITQPYRPYAPPGQNEEPSKDAALLARENINKAVLSKLLPVFAEQKEAWGLRAFQHDLPETSPAFFEAVKEAMPPPMPEGCRVSFFARNDAIGSQLLTVAFLQMPNKAVREAIEGALQQAFEQAVAA